MDKITYNKKLQELNDEYQKAKNELAIQCATENNPYKIDDVITDHIGSIKISKMKAHSGFYSIPEMMYFGVELKKDGTPKKNGDLRWVHQSNILK